MKFITLTKLSGWVDNARKAGGIHEEPVEVSVRAITYLQKVHSSETSVHFDGSRISVKGSVDEIKRLIAECVGCNAGRDAEIEIGRKEDTP